MCAKPAQICKWCSLSENSFFLFEIKSDGWACLFVFLFRMITESHMPYEIRAVEWCTTDTLPGAFLCVFSLPVF